jgi:hypothetical protein
VLVRLDALDSQPGTLPAVTALRRFHGERRARFVDELEEASAPETHDVGAIRLDLIQIERAAIGEAYEKNLITDESRRRLERAFDLEEASVRHASGD